MGYFKDFPLLDIEGVGIAKNIVARPKIDKRDSSVVDFNITSPLRPDQIAYRYYKDQFLDWSVYLANDVIDPYYDFFMDTDVLNRVIINKYGSLEEASQQIVHWENNWRTDNSSISPATYDSLPADVKGLYNATTDGKGTTVSYSRKRKSLKKKTNMIVTYTLSEAVSGSVGDNIVLGTFEGRGTIVANSGTTLIIQHVLDAWDVDAIGAATVVSASVVKSISDTEAPYYSPVTAYEYEIALNEAKRRIKLVPSDQSEALRKELKRALA